MTHTHPHTRSDHPQPTSPRIPRPAMVPRVLHCNPVIEDRIRTILTWNAGECGLISDNAIDVILGYHPSDACGLGIGGIVGLLTTCQ
jgi:hypothetical protein